MTDEWKYSKNVRKFEQMELVENLLSIYLLILLTDFCSHFIMGKMQVLVFF